jgi:hypothetical protein
MDIRERRIRNFGGALFHTNQLDESERQCSKLDVLRISFDDRKYPHPVRNGISGRDERGWLIKEST